MSDSRRDDGTPQVARPVLEGEPFCSTRTLFDYRRFVAGADERAWGDHRWQRVGNLTDQTLRHLGIDESVLTKSFRRIA